MFLVWVRINWKVDSSWNVMAHVDAREGKWRGNWRMEWVASTLHTTSQHGVSNITTADAHTSAASSGLNWRPRRFKWTRPFRLKTKYGFCECAITFQLARHVKREGTYTQATTCSVLRSGVVLCFSSSYLLSQFAALQMLRSVAWRMNCRSHVLRPDNRLVVSLSYQHVLRVETGLWIQRHEWSLTSLKYEISTRWTMYI